MGSPPRLGPLTLEQIGRVNRLRARLSLLEDRYGYRPPDDVERLDRQLQRRNARIGILDEKLDELLAEMVRLESERAGLLTAMELLLTDELAEAALAADEAWSPWPVYGFRMWGVTSGGLVGALEPWATPTMEARCTKLPGNPDVPHTVERCGEPRCGIYAARHPAPLVERRAGEGGWAIGVVALTGKVVEHERGYRAQRAQTRAIVVHHGGRVLSAEEPRMIELAFAATVAATALLGDPESEWPTERTITTLRAAERRLTWTSDLNSE